MSDFGYKGYLGDSVYAEVDSYDGGTVKLTTENGVPGDPSNTIILEPEIMVALLRFYRDHCGEIK
jgi:hypothetical protein